MATEGYEMAVELENGPEEMVIDDGKQTRAAGSKNPR